MHENILPYPIPVRPKCYQFSNGGEQEKSLAQLVEEAERTNDERLTQMSQMSTKKMQIPSDTSPLPKLPSAPLPQCTPPPIPVPPPDFIFPPKRQEEQIIVYRYNSQSFTSLQSVQCAIIYAARLKKRFPSQVYLSEHNCIEYRFDASDLRLSPSHYELVVCGRAIAIPVSSSIKYLHIPDNVVVCAFY